MELVRSQNANTISEFYPHEICHEGAIFEDNLEKIIFFIFSKKMHGNSPALQVLAREPG